MVVEEVLVEMLELRGVVVLRRGGAQEGGRTRVTEANTKGVGLACLWQG